MARRKTQPVAEPTAEVQSAEAQAVIENIQRQTDAVEEVRRDPAPEPAPVEPAEAIPAAAQAAEPPPAAADVHVLPVCSKCGGTGEVAWGKCFACAHDAASPAKGYLDHVDIEKNRRHALSRTAHYWNLMVRATVDGAERTAPKSFAAAGAIYVRRAGRTVEAKPADVAVGETVLVPRLVMTEGRKEAVGLLEATVLEKREVKPALPF